VKNCFDRDPQPALAISDACDKSAQNVAPIALARAAGLAAKDRGSFPRENVCWRAWCCFSPATKRKTAKPAVSLAITSESGDPSRHVLAVLAP
jgi:hypothetical protein